MKHSQQGFSTIKTEGLLLPPELIARVADLDPKLPGIRPEDYNLPKGERINEATNRSWNRLTALWARFRKELEGLHEGDAATGLTRDRWLLPLFDELGYGRLQRHQAFDIDGKSYAISHLWGHAPIHLVGAGLDLDQRAPGQVGAAQASPHGLVQQFLNRTDDHLWAFVSNGLKLRILRDNLSLTRQAYVEFDLAAMMDGELYSDFRLLWLLCHQSRVESERPNQCWLEKWSQEARQQGARALEHLREGVEKAISALGSGFLAHPGNTGLQARLASGDLEAQDYYRQLLRLVYRLIFRFVAEDRDLLLAADDETARQRYRDYYSTARLRRMAHRLKGSRHEDLFEGLKVVMAMLYEEGCPQLALPALGSFLWDPAKLPDLSSASIRNRDLLEAVRALAFVKQERALRPIDYRNLGPEELGSVYESLLELHPELHRESASFGLRTAAGSERKTTGSYYTPESLIQALMDSGLDPLLDRAAAQTDPERAILDLKVCDPAAGSGHFLVAAAHRIARRLAAVRSGEEEPAPHAVAKALRDVVSHWLYGVDFNPMAVELCKVSLWMTAMDARRPLSFLDHRIRLGNSLIGASPELIAQGIPDDAFKPIADDDKKVCASLRKRNKSETSGQRDMLELMVAESAADYDSITARTHRIDSAPDDTIAAVREKSEQYQRLIQSPEYFHASRVADTWCAAFVWEKRPAPAATPVTTDTLRRLETDPQALSQGQRETIERLAGHYQFFHWHLAFPEVFAQGGFDMTLGNPPWDTLSPDRREYFGQHRPGMRSLSPTQQDEVIEDLLQDPTIADDWRRHQRDLFALVHFLKNSGRYTLYAPGNLGKGDFNVYRMFTELALRQTRLGGYTALVLPGGIYGGANASAIRKFLLDDCELKHLWGLINTSRGWFAEVDIDRFAAFSARRGDRTQSFLAHFGLKEPADLASEPVEMDANFLRSNAPDTYAIPDVRSSSDLTVAAKMLSRHPIFGDLGAGPPIRHYQRELDMGNDRHRFTTDPTGLPVYEGRMISHFDHRAKTYESGHGNSSVWIERSFSDPKKAITPQWRVLPEDIPDKLGDRCERYRLAFGDVANPRNERSFVAAMVPPGAICGHTVPTILFDEAHSWSYLPWLAIANSFVMDAFVRKKLSSPHLTYSVMDSLPFPRPNLDEPWVQHAAPLVLRLICTAPEMTDYWNAMAKYALCTPVTPGTVPPDALLDETKRDAARAELDAIVALDVYGLTKSELSEILETFPVVKKRDIKRYGDFRTKLLILASYDTLKNAPDTNDPQEATVDALPRNRPEAEPYQSRRT